MAGVSSEGLAAGREEAAHERGHVADLLPLAERLAPHGRVEIKLPIGEEISYLLRVNRPEPRACAI